MGKALRVVQIEPFAALFSALGMVLAHILEQVTQPAGLTSLNYGTVRTAVESWVYFDRRSVASQTFPL